MWDKKRWKMRKKGIKNEGEGDRKLERKGWKMRHRGIENEGERVRK